MPRRANPTVWSSDQGDLRKQNAAVSETVPLPPGKQTVYLHRDSKGRGGKSVTLVKNLALSEEDMKELARKLMEAEAETSTTGYSNSALALARYYRDNKRYEDERALLSGLEERLGVPLHDKLASRLRRVTQLAAKAKLKD